MNPPHFLLDALNDSITSGTFVDTKFYVFSRREASGRVGAPQALYCNSRVLDTIPYFSSLFSEGFAEGRTRDINEGFPPDSHPYTYHYDYLSDSDLEDGTSCSEEEDEEYDRDSQQSLEYVPNQESSRTIISDDPSPCLLSVETSEAKNIERSTPLPIEHFRILNSDHRSNGNLTRMGKVAIIRDMGAVTFEAMLYFLYTGEIKFAPLSSDPRHELPARARTGDWTVERLPSPSAKSIYRLADKYDIPTLKERARAHIRNNLEHCDIVEEVFSRFSFSFPEMLSMQVSLLVRMIKEESKGGTGSITREQLRGKLSTLSQPRFTRAIDVLAMILDGVRGSLKSPTAESKFTPDMTPTPFPNWHRTKIALHKSISTGVLIDLQFYAYNAIGSGLPLDPKPLFTSSIVIEEWGAAITTPEEAVGINSQAACLADGLTDDYECWHGELHKELHKDETLLQYKTEAVTTEGREVVILMSGAWKTWASLLSYTYTNEMTFTSLQTSTHDNDPAVDAEVRRLQSCSSRSMYSLAATLRIEAVMEVALKNIKSKLSTSNIVQELFSSFAASHRAILETEIRFLREKFTEKDHKSLMDQIQRMASEETPFFPTTFSLVYDKLLEDALSALAPNVASFSVPNVTLSFTHNGTFPSTHNITFPSTSNITSSSNLHVSLNATKEWVGLICARRRCVASVHDLYDGLHCPRCPDTGRNGRGEKGRPFMRCTKCNTLRDGRRNVCLGSKCGRQFR